MKNLITNSSAILISKSFSKFQNQAISKIDAKEIKGGEAIIIEESADA